MSRPVFAYVVSMPPVLDVDDDLDGDDLTPAESRAYAIPRWRVKWDISERDIPDPDGWVGF